MVTPGKVSIIIPSRNEIFLSKTVNDLLAKATGDIEVIPILDGYWPVPEEISHDERVTYLHRSVAHGMRDGINSAAAIARGEFLMKIDAHCMVEKGFDEVLKADIEKNWVVIPRRNRLDAENWTLQDVGKPAVDYEFLSYPWWKPDEPGIHGTIWAERAKERMDHKYDIDENMGFQGSCWFMFAEHFHQRIGGMQEEGYGSFIGEPQEIGNKTWLGGGKVMVNKKTSYAHLHKGKTYGRGYFFDKSEAIEGNRYSVNFWFNNLWKNRIHDFEWLVDRFWPVPSWPEDRELWKPRAF